MRQDHKLKQYGKHKALNRGLWLRTSSSGFLEAPRKSEIRVFLQAGAFNQEDPYILQLWKFVPNTNVGMVFRDLIP